MRVLVTNDDGVHAPGIHALTQAVLRAGFDDVIVCAPLDDRSGASAALGTVYGGDGVVYEELDLEAVEGVPVFGVDGPPALAVVLGRLGAFGEPPDLIVSGINPGANTGRAVLHSGTVGAALTAASFGASGVAVSVQATADGDHWFATAAHIAELILPWMATAERRTVLNVNVPDVPIGQVKGVRTAKLAPFGTVRTVVVGKGEGRLQLELQETDEVLPDDTDTMIVRAGYVAVTSLVGPRPVDDAGALGHLDEALTNLQSEFARTAASSA